jgi:hypothetical protein
MKKIICVVLILTLALALTACQVGNRQVGWDTTQTFTHAILELGNGELIEGTVTSWRDFDESDVVQFTMNGITYLTHYSKVILTTEKP